MSFYPVGLCMKMRRWALEEPNYTRHDSPGMYYYRRMFTWALKVCLSLPLLSPIMYTFIRASVSSISNLLSIEPLFPATSQLFPFQFLGSGINLLRPLLPSPRSPLPPHECRELNCLLCVKWVRSVTWYSRFLDWPAKVPLVLFDNG